MIFPSSNSSAAGGGRTPYRKQVKQGVGGFAAASRSPRGPEVLGEEWGEEWRLA